MSTHETGKDFESGRTLEIRLIGLAAAVTVPHMNTIVAINTMTRLIREVYGVLTEGQLASLSKAQLNLFSVTILDAPKVVRISAATRAKLFVLTSLARRSSLLVVSLVGRSSLLLDLL